MLHQVLKRWTKKARAALIVIRNVYERFPETRPFANKPYSEE